MKPLFFTLLAATALAASPADARGRWSEAQANGWYAKQTWLAATTTLLRTGDQSAESGGRNLDPSGSLSLGRQGIG